MAVRTKKKKVAFDQPAMVGPVQLSWPTQPDRPGYTRQPKRDGGIITMPHAEKVEEFHLLGGGWQFLLTMEPIDKGGLHPSTQMQPSVYYGGFDQAPFLWQLLPAAILAYWGGGEVAFTEALRPTIIQQMVAKGSWNALKQQGSFFAYPLGRSLDELWQWYRSSKKQGRFSVSCSHVRGDEGGHWFNNTPHTLSGECFSGQFEINGLGQFKSGTYSHRGVGPVVGEGTLLADGYPPLFLEGLHVMAQCPILHDGRWQEWENPD